MLDALDCQDSEYTMTSVMGHYLNAFFSNWVMQFPPHTTICCDQQVARLTTIYCVRKDWRYPQDVPRAAERARDRAISALSGAGAVTTACFKSL